MLRSPTRAATAAAEDEASDGEEGQTAVENVDPETAFRERRTAEANAAAKATADEAKEIERQRFCTQARSQLAALNSGQRIARMSADGEREFLDDAARSAEVARLQQQVAEHCQ